MDINTLTLAERERLAYIEGYTEAATLFAQLDDAEHEVNELGGQVTDLQHDLICATDELNAQARILRALGE